MSLSAESDIRRWRCALSLYGPLHCRGLVTVCGGIVTVLVLWMSLSAESDIRPQSRGAPCHCLGLLTVGDLSLYARAPSLYWPYGSHSLQRVTSAKVEVRLVTVWASSLGTCHYARAPSLYWPYGSHSLQRVTSAQSRGAPCHCGPRHCIGLVTVCMSIVTVV